MADFARGILRKSKIPYIFILDIWPISYINWLNMLEYSSRVVWKQRVRKIIRILEKSCWRIQKDFKLEWLNLFKKQREVWRNKKKSLGIKRIKKKKRGKRRGIINLIILHFHYIF